MNRTARGLGLVAWCTAPMLAAGCGASEDDPEADDPAPTTASPTTSPTPSVTKEPAPDIDWSAPPEYVRFRSWIIERFPVPRGSEPRTADGRRGDFSAYVFFADGDLERLSAFYEKALRQDGYATNVDVYGTVTFAGSGVEGGIYRGRGDEIGVVINRSSL